MASLKAYTLGIHGFASRTIFDALGEPGHIRQAHSVIVASSKKQAAELAGLHGFGHVTMSDPEFRMVSGPNMHPSTAALIELAGDVPTVFAYSMNNYGDSSPVVAVDGDGPRLVGHHRRVNGSLTFVPLDGAS